MNINNKDLFLVKSALEVFLDNLTIGYDERDVKELLERVTRQYKKSKVA